MSEYERLNTMSEEELREFAVFAYVSYPTLLVTHEKRQEFFAQYPEKNPNRNSQDAHQMELDLGSKENN